MNLESIRSIIYIQILYMLILTKQNGTVPVHHNWIEHILHLHFISLRKEKE